MSVKFFFTLRTIIIIKKKSDSIMKILTDFEVPK